MRVPVARYLPRSNVTSALNAGDCLCDLGPSNKFPRWFRQSASGSVRSEKCRRRLRSENLDSCSSESHETSGRFGPSLSARRSPTAPRSGSGRTGSASKRMLKPFSGGRRRLFAEFMSRAATGHVGCVTSARRVWTRLGHTLTSTADEAGP